MVQGGGFYFFGKGASIPFAYDNTTRYRSVLENGQISLIRQSDDTTIGQLSVDMTNTSSTELMYFGTSNNDNFASYPGYYKLYGSRVWDSGELKLDLVPVRDLVTGKVGLRNRLDGTLLASNTSTPLVAGPTVAGSKVETEEEAGSLHVVVPDGATNVNVGLSLKGALKLVKEGGGTLTVMKEGQDYVGGTRIAAGEVNLVGGMYDKDFISANMYIGKTCTNYEAPYAEIVVESNAVFDIKGNLDYRFYKMVLAGGSLRNSGRNQVDTQGSLGTVALSEDSSIESVNRLCFCDVLDLKLDLGGHVLTADTHDASIFFYNHLIVTNGTLSAVGNGPLRFRSTVDARTAKLHVACPLSVSDTMEVGDYYAACTANVNAGTGMMNVYGRFTPATDYFYGCELQNGSVLDLNEREGTWSTTSAFTDGRNRVTFASGATVTIDVHARKQWKGKIVDWGFGNKPIVTFKMSEKSRRMGRMLRVGEDGLYATGGTALLLR